MTQTAETKSEPFLARLGRSCHERRWVVLGAWIVALVVIGGASGAMGPGFTTEFSPPDTESKTGFEIVDEYFGGQGAGISGTIVFTAPQGVTDPGVQSAMEDLFAEVDGLRDVSVVILRMSQLELVDATGARMIGDIVQQGITQEDYSLTGAVLAASTIAFWVTVLSYLSWRSRRLGRIIDGAPTVIVLDRKPN